MPLSCTLTFLPFFIFVIFSRRNCLLSFVSKRGFLSSYPFFLFSLLFCSSLSRFLFDCFTFVVCLHERSEEKKIKRRSEVEASTPSDTQQTDHLFFVLFVSFVAFST